MAATFTGDFRKIEQWAKQAEAAGKRKIMREISDNLAEETITLIADGFRKSRDPYGRRWKKKQFRDGRRTLVGNTARLRNGWHRKRVGASGFTVGPSVMYAVYHQTGTGIHGPSRSPIKPRKANAMSWKVGSKRVAFRSVKGVPKRKMIPDRGRLPRTWESAYEDAADAFLTAHFRG